MKEFKDNVRQVLTEIDISGKTGALVDKYLKNELHRDLLVTMINSGVINYNPCLRTVQITEFHKGNLKRFWE